MSHHYRHLYRHHPIQGAFEPYVGLPTTFYPDRFGHWSFDEQMRKMTDDMNDLYRNMQKQVSRSLGGGDSWLTEDLRMDNPVETDDRGNRNFKLHFDLHQFRPEEIKVVTKNQRLTVSAKHEETKEGRSTHREYNRSYDLPDDLDPMELKSDFSDTGILNIEAPLPPIKKNKEHSISIEHH